MAKAKGPRKGTGGHGRRRLEGKGPTPKAEDRVYHKAHKAKLERQRRQQGKQNSRRFKGEQGVDTVAGRNSVLEALREGVPAKALYIVRGADSDDRVRDAIAIAADRGVPLLEASRDELDRMTDRAVHQGLALVLPPYEYATPKDLLDAAAAEVQKPLLVALDGITDARNLGAIIRSAAAFGGHGVIIPERRSAAMNAGAWKTSAGAAARIRVAQVVNLARELTELKKQGVFVLGLDMDGDVDLPELSLGTEPVCLVVGSEGTGLSRLIRETCDQIVSIPMAGATESLNAGVAAAVSLYEIARTRGLRSAPAEPGA